MKLDPEKLLEINPDQLFKDHTVQELQDVQKAVQLEIERKREELRSTVGEKYRDLLKAADTITDMRETAQTVVSCVNNVTALCHTLQEKHLLGFKTSEIPTSAKERILSADEVSIVLEIKILLTMPERIWTAIDEKQFAFAAELYLLSAHTHLGLQVSRASEKYPLIRTQWNTIVACRQTVLDLARKELKETTLSTTNCTNCIISILFLEPKTLNEALSDYLLLRAEAFKEIIQTDEENPTVKDKLRAAILSVQHTLLVTCNCFLGNPGLIEAEVAGLTGESSKATLTKFPAISPLAQKNLSQVVKELKPSTLRPVSSLSVSVVRACVEEWIQNVQEILKSEMRNLLGLVGNLRGIVGVRERVSSVPVPPLWNAVEGVFGPFNVYGHIVEPHVSARTLQLVSFVWEETTLALQETLTSVDDAFNKDGTVPSEVNVRWFIWKEFETDEVAVQVRGFTPRVAELCKLLDERLQALLEDVNVFVADVKDKEPLLEFLNSNSYETIRRFSSTLIESASRKVPGEASIIIRARLLQAMTSQCPHLKKCFNQSDRQGQRDSHSWSEMVNTLYEASIEIWRIWLTSVTPSFEGLVQEKLDIDVSVASFLLSRPACELKIITEENDDKQISSELRVASQPSFSLQALLLQICLRLNAIAVHTLPRVIHLEIIMVVINLILGHYDKLCSMDTIYPSHAWQLLLDIRFLTLLFLPRDCQSTSQALWSRLEAKIDPFDLNVYLPYIQANVRKSVIRLQGTFGVLVDQSEKLAFLNSLKVEAGPQNTTPEDPNVLALSAGVPYFTLLPISSGGARKKEESPNKQGKQRSKETKKESTSTDFVKSAGSFFGGLTGGWS